MEYPATEDPLAEEKVSSAGRLFTDLLRDLGNLFRQELELAKCELGEKALDAKEGAAKLGTGVGFCLAAAVVLSAAIVLGLTLLLSQWMAPLLAAFISALGVGIVLGTVGFALIRNGSRTLSPRNFVPESTVESLKENARWAKERV